MLSLANAKGSDVPSMPGATVAEVFDWAGECRDVHLFATGTDITYCLYEEVDGRLEALFDDLAEKDWLQGLDDWTFATALAHAWAEPTFTTRFGTGTPAARRSTSQGWPSPPDIPSTDSTSGSLICGSCG